MKNELIYKLLSKVVVKVTGSNTERFIKRLATNKIDLLNIQYIDRKTLYITIYSKDYEKLNQIKSIYELEIVDHRGIIKIKKKIQTSRLIIAFLILGYIILIFLTNVIFDVEIIHTNKEIRNILFKELDSYGLKPYHFKKKFDQIEKIKNEIISKNKNKIEWMEIERIGTKYVVRVEMRKINEIKEETTKKHIVAKKDAIIKKVLASSGQIIKKENDFVKAGDIIISGNITLNDNIKDIVDAKGEVYGEVWYQVSVSHPFEYYEEIETGKKKKVFVLKIFNKEIELFNFKPFKNKKKQNKIYLKHLFLPINLSYQTQKEISIIKENYNEEEALKKAEEIARDKIQSKLNDNEYIIGQKNLKINIKDSKIIVDVFFSVYENITDYLEIVSDITEKPNS